MCGCCRVLLFALQCFLGSLANAGPMAYFVTGGGNLLVVDTATNTVAPPITVGSNPYAAVANAAGTRVYVSNFGSNSVAVVDATTNTVLTTIPVATGPQGLAVNAAGTRVYVASFTAGAVTVIDAGTNTVVTTIPVPNAVDVAVNAAGTRVYVAAGGVSIVDTTTNAVIGAMPATGLQAFATVALSPDGGKLYAWSSGSFRIAVFDVTNTSFVTSISIATTTFANNGLAVHPSGAPLYLSTGSDVTLVNPATNTVSGTIPLGGTASVANGVAVTPDGSRVYSASGSGVKTFDTATSAVTTIATGGVRALGKFIGIAGTPCVGFTDVPATSPFCANVEWLKNRGITLGCTSTTLYCPTDPVTRLSMAAFMNRLGKALSPEVLAVESAGGAVALPATSPLPRLCTTGDSTVTSYPRSVTVTSSVTGLASASAVAWRAFVTWSTDGGVAWQSAGASPIAVRASSAAGQWSGATPSMTLDLAPNLAYRFAIALQRDDLLPGTTGNFMQTHCMLSATVDNRNGASSPFDVQQNDAEPVH